MNTTNDPAPGRKNYSFLRRGAANVIGVFAVLTRPARFHPPGPWPLPPQRFAIAAGLVVATYLLILVVVDAAAINMVARLPGVIPWAFDQITDFGKSGWFLWPLGILFLILATLPVSERMARLVVAAVMVRVGFLFLAISVPGVITNIVKHIIGRARPGVGGSVDPYLFSPFSWPPAYASLPSGHGTTVFSVIVAFGSLWPRTRPVLWVYALLIATSRVAVTAHYPSDLFGAAIVGAGGAFLVRRWFALRRLGFTVDPDGVVHAFPGPPLKRIKSVARDLLA